MSFQKVEQKIDGEGYSKKSAGAILAKKTRDASPAAKKTNPNLKKVKGKAAAAKKSAGPQPQWAGVANQMLGGKC